jgi:hypothetical protein
MQLSSLPLDATPARGKALRREGRIGSVTSVFFGAERFGVPAGLPKQSAPSPA